MKLVSTMSAVLVFASATFAFAAQSYIVVDNQTGMILSSQRPNDKLQVASLTKIATAMVTLDWAQLSKADLSQMAVISAEHSAPEASTQSGCRKATPSVCAIFSTPR